MHVFLTLSNPITSLKLLLLFSGNKIISHVFTSKNEKGNIYKMLRLGHREMQMAFGGLPVCDQLCLASFFQTWASSASRSSGSGLLSDHKASVLLLWWTPEKQHKGDKKHVSRDAGFEWL